MINIIYSNFFFKHIFDQLYTSICLWEVYLKLKKAVICSRDEAPHIEETLLLNNFQIDKTNPDFIISYGGDGTVLTIKKAKSEVRFIKIL